jgi:glycosyltransferase involved in cell wall biosynthesis
MTAMPLQSEIQEAVAKVRRIRVLQLGSPTGMYGAERWILALVKHLPRDQVESIVATIKDSPGDVPELCGHAAAIGVHTEVFEGPGRLSLTAIRLLNRYIRTNRIDIVHTHWYKTDIIARLAVRGTSCKVVSTPHGWSTSAGVKLWAYEMLDRLVFYSLDAVAPLSPDLYDGLLKFPRLHRKLHLIPNGVDLSELDAPTEPLAELSRWRDSGDQIMGYVGQLIPRKGIDTLIRAFSALPFTNRRLCIVGEGPQSAELQKLAASLGEGERIRFFGYRPDRIALLRQFDAFVLPSALEGTPRCLLEAMAVGVPVVGSDIPGCRTLIKPGNTGLLFAVGDVAGLASALQQMLTDRALRASLSREAEKYVRGEFSAATMAVRYADLYRRVLAGTRSV